LENSRTHNNNQEYAVWTEEDYCSPTLAMERESVLYRNFDDILFNLSIQNKKDGVKLGAIKDCGASTHRRKENTKEQNEFWIKTIKAEPYFSATPSTTHCRKTIANKGMSTLGNPIS
jgi:hypothetical protein